MGKLFKFFTPANIMKVTVIVMAVVKAIGGLLEDLGTQSNGSNESLSNK